MGCLLAKLRFANAESAEDEAQASVHQAGASDSRHSSDADGDEGGAHIAKGCAQGGNCSRQIDCCRWKMSG